MNIDEYEGPVAQMAARLCSVDASNRPPVAVGDPVPELGPSAIISAIEPGLITVSMRVSASAEDIVIDITAAPSTSARP